jgi:hypothetical protein
LGLVTIDVPPGTERVGFRFGPTRAVIAAGLIVAISVLGWALRGWTHRWQMRRRNRYAITVVAPLLVGLIAILIANGAGVRTQRHQAVETWRNRWP